MLSDHQVIESVRRADPVANVDDLPEPRLDAAGLLAAAGKELVMSTINDRPATQPAPPPMRLRRLRAGLAFTFAGLAVLAVIGVVGVLKNNDESPTGEVTTTLDGPTDGTGLRWAPIGGAQGLDSVRALVPNCCFNVALGDDSMVVGWGQSFTGPGPTPIPTEFGPFRSIAVSGVREFVAVPAVGPSTTPYAAAYDSTPRVQGWTTAALPTDVPSPHPDVVMLYTVQSVVQQDPDYVVYGWAQPEIDPAVIAREHPELAPVVRTDLLPPCCDGEPLTTEIADPLWVWTDDPSSEPTAISLSIIGLTREDLRGITGVVWVFHKPTGPSPWVAETTLITDNVGPEFFLESGTSGFALLTSRTTGGYDAWTSPSGDQWTKHESTLADVVDLTVWEGRTLVLTANGSILELIPDGTLASFTDAGTFDLPDAKPAHPVRIEAGDRGIAVVGERDEVLPWSDGEPIPTAQVLWFSADGSKWQHEELSDTFGDIGAVEVLVTIHQGHRAVAPSVIIALGVDQANGGPITNPQWWGGR